MTITKRHVWFALAFLLVLVIGYSAGTARDADETPSPEPTVEITQSPTAEITPSPTIEPTLEPVQTPEPTLSSSDTIEAYLGYLNAIIVWSESSADLSGDVSDALSDSDAATAADAVRALSVTHQTLIDYLDENPPKDCYAAEADNSRAAAEAYLRSADPQIRWLDDWPFGSADDFDDWDRWQAIGAEHLNNFVTSDC
jgi:hypothetical protein